MAYAEASFPHKISLFNRVNISKVSLSSAEMLITKLCAKMCVSKQSEEEIKTFEFSQLLTPRLSTA